MNDCNLQLINKPIIIQNGNLSKILSQRDIECEYKVNIT